MQSLNASVGVVGVSGSGEIPGLQSLLANTHCASAAAEECDLYSQPSIGVRSSLVDTDSWYIQQRRRQQRHSRIQNIAATGRDSYYAMPSPSYSTASSSIRNGKSGAVEIESTTDFSDPVIDVHAGDAPEASTMSVDNVAAVFSTNNEKRQRDSSVLWMHNPKQSWEPASPDAQIRVEAAPRYAGTKQPKRLMFYSSQTGAVHAPSLQNFSYNGMDLETLLDAMCGETIGNTPAGLCFWLDVNSATTQELHRLSDLFGLHPLTVEDIELKCSRDKIDTFGDYLFIVYHTSTQRKRNKWRHYYSYCRANSSIRPAASSINGVDGIPPGISSSESALDIDAENDSGDGQILIVLKGSFVLTFHSGCQQDVVSSVLKRLLNISAVSARDQDQDQQQRTNKASLEFRAEPDSDLLAGLVDYPAYIVYAILDEITDQLSPEIAAIEQQVDAIDELVLILSHAEHESVLQQMGEQRRRILRVWQLTQPKPEVITTLARILSNSHRGKSTVSLAHRALAAEVVQYLGDVQEHLLSVIDACSRAEAVLSRSHSNYLAKISLELSRATFDSNSTTERWTMLGTIVVPINIVTSFLGVNLKVPGQDRDDTLNFFVVLGCMLIYTGVTLAFWRWRQIV
ncbi:CorA metal ion transporter [Coemansia sp. RSA 2705]|nr:CorA metal ion transporter [Coemansia sp. RSA 2705]